MFLEAIRLLYAHREQTMDRILVTAEALTTAEFTVMIVAGQTPIRDTLVHVIDAETCHIRWLDGSMTREASFARKFPPGDYPDVIAVRAFWHLVARETATLLDSLATDADLERSCIRQYPDGRIVVRALWEVLLHVASHSTQHRSEAALMLTSLGHSPGNLDVL